MNPTLYLWPGHDEALEGGPQKPATPVEAFSEYVSIPRRQRHSELALAIFTALTQSQQERIVEYLGWTKAPESPQEAPGATIPEEPGLAEASHVAQWIELSTRARNSGLKVWLDGPDAFAIRVGGDGMWKRCLSLYELRAAISDYVAHERTHGREPKPLGGTQEDPGSTITDLEARWGLLASSILEAAERAGMPTEGLTEPPTGAELLGLVRVMGDSLYQRMMQDLDSDPRPPQTISFMEGDGHERVIVWEPGDLSVGIQPGYRADDSFGDQHSEMLSLLKDIAADLAPLPPAPRIRMLRERIAKKVKEIDPKYGGGW